MDEASELLMGMGFRKPILKLRTLGYDAMPACMLTNLFVASTSTYLTPGKPIVIIVVSQGKHWFIV